MWTLDTRTHAEKEIVYFRVSVLFSFMPFHQIQVKSNFRTAITVPEKCWTRFRDILNEYCEKMSELATTTTADNNHALTSSASASGGGSQKWIDSWSETIFNSNWWKQRKWWWRRIKSNMIKLQTLNINVTPKIIPFTMFVWWLREILAEVNPATNQNEKLLQNTEYLFITWVQLLNQIWRDHIQSKKSEAFWRPIENNSYDSLNHLKWKQNCTVAEV